MKKLILWLRVWAVKKIWGREMTLEKLNLGLLLCAGIAGFIFFLMGYSVVSIAFFVWGAISFGLSTVVLKLMK